MDVLFYVVVYKTFRFTKHENEHREPYTLGGGVIREFYVYKVFIFTIILSGKKKTLHYSFEKLYTQFELLVVSSVHCFFVAVILIELLIVKCIVRKNF